MSSEATYAMSPNSSLASTLSRGHTGCKGAWEVSVWSQGMGRPRQPLAASKKREQLLNDWPAKAATAIVQTLEAAPYSPCAGASGRRRRSCWLSSRNSGGSGRPPGVSSGTRVGRGPGAPAARPKHQPCQALSSGGLGPAPTTRPTALSLLRGRKRIAFPGLLDTTPGCKAETVRPLSQP